MDLNWIGTYEGDPDYEFDALAIEVGEQIVARMEKQRMSQADLARKLGVSRARISQILSGNDNLTLKSIVAVAVGLDCRVDFHLRAARRAVDDHIRPNGRDWPRIDMGASCDADYANLSIPALAGAA